MSAKFLHSVKIVVDQARGAGWYCVKCFRFFKRMPTSSTCPNPVTAVKKGVKGVKIA